MCDIKVVAPIKVATVCKVLSESQFMIEHIAVEDRRLDSITKRDVYALAMTRDEFDKLLSAIGLPEALEAMA